MKESKGDLMRLNPWLPNMHKDACYGKRCIFILFLTEEIYLG
jgi:hypothetical protein